MVGCARRGQSLVEILIGLGLFLPVLLLGVVLIGMASRGMESTLAYDVELANITHLLDRWDSESHASMAIFTPLTDALGAANCDAQGRCREVDFFQRDAQQVPHFWGYYFDHAAKTLQRITFGPQRFVSGGSFANDGPPTNGITTFFAQKLPASKLDVPILGTYRITNVPPFNLGFPFVESGNAVTSIEIGNRVEYVRKHLWEHAHPSTFTMVVGLYSPPPGGQPPTPSSTPTSAPQGGSPTPYVLYRTVAGTCVNGNNGQESFSVPANPPPYYSAAQLRSYNIARSDMYPPNRVSGISRQNGFSAAGGWPDESTIPIEVIVTFQDHAGTAGAKTCG